MREKGNFGHSIILCLRTKIGDVDAVIYIKDGSNEVCNHAVFSKERKRLQFNMYYEMVDELRSIDKIEEFCCQCIYCKKKIVPAKYAMIILGIFDEIYQLIMLVSLASLFLGVAYARTSSGESLLITFAGVVVVVILRATYFWIRNSMMSNILIKSKWIYFEIEGERLKYMKESYLSGSKIVRWPFMAMLIYSIIFN